MKKNRAAVSLGKLRAAKGPNMAETGSLGGKARAAALSDTERSESARVAGLVGGAARAAKLTPEQRREIAQKAAAKRWAKTGSTTQGAGASGKSE
jgi:hypothetical protein